MGLRAAIALSGIGLTKETLKSVRNWTDRGLVRLMEPNPGINSPRRYSIENVVEIRALFEAKLAGSPLQLGQQLADIMIARLRAKIAMKVRWWDEDDECELIYGIRYGRIDKHAFLSPDRIAASYKTQGGVAAEIAAVGMGRTHFPADYLLRRILEEYTGDPEGWANLSDEITWPSQAGTNRTKGVTRKRSKT